jgi:hypothetical protein
MSHIQRVAHLINVHLNTTLHHTHTPPIRPLPPHIYNLIEYNVNLGKGCSQFKWTYECTGVHVSLQKLL